jgi:hypothetical protein
MPHGARCGRKPARERTMRKLDVAVLVAVTIATTGCSDLLSLHALFTARDRVFDSALEGAWENDDNRLIVERAGDLYRATVQGKRDPSDTVKYDVRVASVNGVRFADLRQMDTIGHMVARVRAGDGELRLAFLDAKWLRDRVPHEDADVEDGKRLAVLTISTDRLRQLVGRFASEPRAYDTDIVFRRPK